MCDCNKYHLGKVDQGSIDFMKALSGGYFVAALVSMGFNFKNPEQYANACKKIEAELGASALDVFKQDVAIMSENIDVLTAQFQVMNQALGLKETNPYVLTPTELHKSFADYKLNIIKPADRQTWLSTFSVQYNNKDIDMNETEKVLNTIPLNMTIQPGEMPTSDRVFATQQDGGTGNDANVDDAADANKPNTATTLLVVGAALLAGWVIYAGIKDHKKQSHNLSGVSKTAKPSSGTKKIVQTITL